MVKLAITIVLCSITYEIGFTLLVDETNFRRYVQSDQKYNSQPLGREIQETSSIVYLKVQYGVYIKLPIL